MPRSGDSSRQVFGQTRKSRRFASPLFTGVAFGALMAVSAVAQTHTVISNGTVSGPVTMDTDGDSLSVENGGTVSNGVGAAVFAFGNVTAIGIDISNAGVIESGGSAAIWAFDAANINSFYNAETGRIAGDTRGLLLQDSNLSDMFNAGRITGATNQGIFVDTGDLTRLTNTQTGVISGATFGIDVQSGNLTGLRNDGVIAGGTQTGIFVLNGDLVDFVNSESGIIAGGNTGLGGDFFADGDVRNIVNAGRITGNSAAGIFIDHNDLTNLTNLATGLIDGATLGVHVDGTLSNFTNAGTVIADGNVVGTVSGVSANNIINLTNTGSITATNPGAGDAEAIRSEAITSIINSGRIFSDLGGANYAIHEHGAGADTDLTLLPGSLIRGRIDIEGGGAGTNRLFIGNGLSAVLTFDTALPDAIETYGALTATNGLVVATADTSAVAAEDNAVSDLMRSVSGITGQRFHKGSTLGIWAKGFGAASATRPAGATVGVNHAYGGALVGADATLGDSLRLGLFGGLSKGMLNTAVPNGHEIRADNYFAGAYSRFDAGSFYLGFGLTGGINVYDSTRLITNNRLGDDTLDHAEQTYDGYFISPEITIGSEALDFAGTIVRPSATLRYSHIHADGFAETGVTDGDVSIGDRNTDVLDARLQAAMPLETGLPDTLFELRAGVDGRFVVAGGAFDATLAGTTANGFDPGGARLGIGAFAGLDFTRELSEYATLFASAELGLGTETAFRANAEAGLKIAF